MVVTADDQERRRNLLYLSQPLLWPVYPFLPLVRRRPDGEQDLGLLFDLMGMYGIPGYAATVFLANLLIVPPKLKDFLTSPKEVFDTPEEVFEAGWRVD